MVDIVDRLRERSGKYDEYAWHSDIEIEAAIEIERLRESLREVLEEAIGWLDDSRGCKPTELTCYTGWAERAENLLSLTPPPAA